MENPFCREELEKVYVTLHIGDKKPIKIIKKNVYIAAATAAIVLTGSLYTFGGYKINSEKLQMASSELEQLKNEKEQLETKARQLETENNAYSSQLTDIEQKTQEIENKINQLEDSKEELYDKLNKISSTSGTGTDGVQSASTETSSAVSAFTPFVLTPFNCDNTKTSYLTAKLDVLSNAVSSEEVEYTDVSQDVVQTLSNMTTVPSIWPVRGQVSSEFSYRDDPINSSNAFHTGIDIRTPIGTPVKAAASGTVIQAYFNQSGYGNMVEIDHGNGYTTLYAHNSELNVAAGDKVLQGDIIAYSGATGRVTGPHVHYEVMINGELQNPRDYLN